MLKEPTHSYLQVNSRVKVWRLKLPRFTAWYHPGTDTIELIAWQDDPQEGRKNILLDKASKYVKHQLIIKTKNAE